jgi:hypothetical protein
LFDIAVKRFVILFVAGLFVFAIANFVSAIVRSDDIDAPDSAERYGFPFLIFAEDHYHDPNPYFSRLALCGNVGIAIVATGLAAAIVTKAWKNHLESP